MLAETDYGEIQPASFCAELDQKIGQDIFRGDLHQQIT